MEVVIRCLLVEFVRLFVSQQSVVAVSPLGKFEALELTATKRLGIIIKKEHLLFITESWLIFGLTMNNCNKVSIYGKCYI